MKHNFLIKLKSIKARMFITVIIGVTLLFVVLLANNTYSDRLIRERLDTTMDNMSDLSGEYMELRIRKSDIIAIDIAGNEEATILSSIYLAESDTFQTLSHIKESVSEQISYHAKANEEIDSIYLYYKSRRSFIDSNGAIEKTDNPDVMAWVEQNTTWDSEVIWKDYTSEISGKSLLSIMYRLEYFSKDIRTPVFLGINFDKNAIFDFLDQIKLTQNSTTALVNFNDNVYIIDSDIVTRIDLKLRLKDNIVQLEKGDNVTVDIQGLGKSVLKYTPLAYGSGGIVHIIPEVDMQPYRKNLKPLVIATAAVVSLLFVLILMVMVNQYIDMPIKKLIKHMKKLEVGRFSDKIEEERDDEFGKVYQAYNNMTVEIEKLIQELYQEKLVKREMELKILQEKINPHFLYNTLDTINWIAMEHQVDDISKMVIALSTMYRKTFNRGRDLISIEDVMTSISCYLEIQQIRYGESFEYEIDCGENTKNLEILNLIIQTLVENAIIHGMEGMKENGKISIITRRKGDFLNIEVADNGLGMDVEKLNLIRASISSLGMESESGLRNVQKRIKLYYGNEYGIKIDSMKGSGTSIWVTIPAIEENDD
ncbi:MAG: sensor histidine kinase [Clostridiales bacterium]|nr:sensor histidine kinase [Clostridiales bacterium]